MHMRIHFECYGCTQNVGETLLYRKALESLEGIGIVDDPERADLCVVGTCVVIETTENRMLKRIRTLVDMGKKVVVTGCLPKVSGDQLPQEVVQYGFTDVAELVALVEEMKSEFPLDATMEEGSEPANPKTAIVPISQGCLGACAYCITRLARGKLMSYDPKEILASAEAFIQDGKKEILLTAQDTGAYGFDRKDVDLPGLVRMITSTDPPDGIDYRLRIGMMNPDSAVRILPELVKTFKNPRVFRFLHIPVQSGDGVILKRMKRRYSVELFKDILKGIREEVPDITISTDIIVGFPGEREEQFQRSYDMIKEIEPDILNITRFSPRPGTEAKDMEGQVHGRIHKERSRLLTALRRDIGLRKNEDYIGRRVSALVTEYGSGDTLVTRLDNYRVVLIPKEPGVEIGTWVDVGVAGATDIYVKGQILE